MPSRLLRGLWLGLCCASLSASQELNTTTHCLNQDCYLCTTERSFWPTGNGTTYGQSGLCEPTDAAALLTCLARCTAAPTCHAIFYQRHRTGGCDGTGEKICGIVTSNLTLTLNDSVGPGRPGAVCVPTQSLAPTSPTAAPTAPTPAPSAQPTAVPSATPTDTPTAGPTAPPTNTPTAIPTGSPVPPTAVPTAAPTATPTSSPTTSPSSHPSAHPTAAPSQLPTSTESPTSAPVPTLAAVEGGGGGGGDGGEMAVYIAIVAVVVLGAIVFFVFAQRRARAKRTGQQRSNPSRSNPAYASGNAGSHSRGSASHATVTNPTRGRTVSVDEDHYVASIPPEFARAPKNRTVSVDNEQYVVHTADSSSTDVDNHYASPPPVNGLGVGAKTHRPRVASVDADKYVSNDGVGTTGPSTVGEGATTQSDRQESNIYSSPAPVTGSVPRLASYEYSDLPASGAGPLQGGGEAVPRQASYEYSMPDPVKGLPASVAGPLQGGGEAVPRQASYEYSMPPEESQSAPMAGLAQSQGEAAVPRAVSDEYSMPDPVKAHPGVLVARQGSDEYVMPDVVKAHPPFLSPANEYLDVGDDSC